MIPEPLIIGDFSTRNVGHPYAPLRDIAGCPVDRLVEKSDVTVIGNDSNVVFEMYPDKDEYTLSTGPYAGFIGCGDVMLTIRSRFSTGSTDPFLIYMLARVLRFDISTLLHGMGECPLTDLIYFLLPDRLDSAMSRGLYKEYRRENHNDLKVRGVIDFGRHISRNIPFQGNVAYTTRDRNHDNALTQLVRHTIEEIARKPLGEAILNRSVTTRDNVAAIREVTPDYRRGSRNRVISACLNMRPHPFYTAWEPLRQLCLRILRHEETGYNAASTDRVRGVLIDMPWLWEEYLATLLTTRGFVHPTNREGRNPIYLDVSHQLRRFPDYYCRDMVVDAKYKREVSHRDDFAQIISYMHCIPASRGILVHPEKESAPVSSYTLNGCGGNLEVYHFVIPQCDTFDSFVRAIDPVEKIFLEYLSH